MSAAEVIGLALVIVVALFTVAILRIVRSVPTPDCHYIAPDDPRLPAGIDKRLDDYAALDPDLAPVFAPGVNRLWQAIRDEQQKGDQA